MIGRRKVGRRVDANQLGAGASRHVEDPAADQEVANDGGDPHSGVRSSASRLTAVSGTGSSLLLDR